MSNNVIEFCRASNSVANSSVSFEITKGTGVVKILFFLDTVVDLQDTYITGSNACISLKADVLPFVKK